MDDETRAALRQMDERIEAQGRDIAAIVAALKRMDEGMTQGAEAILDQTRAEHAVYRLVLGLAAIVATREDAPLKVLDQLRQLSLDVLPQDAKETRDRLETALTVIETHVARVKPPS